IMENTNLSKQQQVSEIMRQMLTQAQTAGQYFTNDQIKEMTRKVSAEVDLVHQQTQNQRYGSSHIGARSEERFSRNAETDLVCRLLLEKKKKNSELQFDEIPKQPGSRQELHMSVLSSLRQ